MSQSDRPAAQADPSAPRSRPSKTNPADPENRKHGASIPGILRTPLTERDGVSLRAEVAGETPEGEREAVDTREAVRRWQTYVGESREVEVVFEREVGDLPDGTPVQERVKGSQPNRFHPEYAKKQYAKLKDLERGLREEYGKRLHTAMLTFTASTTDEDGEALPPVDHLDGPEGVLSSWEAVTRELRRTLEGRRWERLAILEPHESGHLHVHVGVFVDGVVTAETFRSVLEAHVRNCGRAGEQAHDLRPEDDLGSGETAAEVYHVGADRGPDTIENLGTYLAEYLGADGEDPLEAPDHQKVANAVLWATQKQRWRPSNGAQSYMATETQEGDGEEGEWGVVGIVDGDDEFHPISGGGTVATFETGERVPRQRRSGGHRGKKGPPPDERSEWTEGVLSGDRGTR